MVERAEKYRWSSAAWHCGIADDLLLDRHGGSRDQINHVENWATWLEQGLNNEDLKLIRRNSARGLPCGSEDFVARLEAVTGRSLRYRPPGRSPITKYDQKITKGS